MSIKLIGHELQNAIIVRLSTLSKLQEALERARRHEQEVCKVLFETIPNTPMRRFVKDEGVLDTLLKYGRYSTNIDFRRYRFRDLAAAKKSVAELKRAWKNQITVRISTNSEPDRVGIIFGIAQL